MAPSAVDIDIEGVGDTAAVLLPQGLTLDSIPAKRAKSIRMATGVAPASSSDMFKSPSCFLNPKAKKWDHRLTQESRDRRPGSLKGAATYLKDPNVISLGGGLPTSDYFPINEIDINIPMPPSFSSRSETHQIGKYDIRDGKSVYDLEISLNYCQAMGSPQLLRFVTEHTELIHHPPYSDWECALTCGSTSALEMAFRMFCERGDFVLMEEYTFASAVETALPLGLKMLGVPMDAEGLLAEPLDEILSTWDPVAHGGRKPFVLYTIPTGQNPTGATQSLERRKAIMTVAEKHDLYILEDEPYYFLQMQTYHPESGNGSSTPPPTDHTTFLSQLVPSYLSLDRHGRVLRMDSFSKVIAPGTRTGWVTGTSQIIERFVRHYEVSVQNPSGLSQIVLFKLLDQAWGHKGYLDWLMHLPKEYTHRRDIIVQACDKYLSAAKQRNIVSWDPPMAGMFHWLSVDYTLHPLYQQMQGSGALHEVVQKIEERIFLASVNNGVLVSRGSWFRAETNTDQKLFFRATFAAASEEKIVEAIRRFADSIAVEFGL